MGFSLTHLIIFAIVLAVWLVPGWRIATKAGYSGWLSLLLLIPVVNVVLIWVFAFVKWPVESKD
jgi:hypothetical protein